MVSCGAVGFKSAQDFKKNLSTLEELSDILNYMEWELKSRLTPLPQLCRQAAEHGKTLRQFFLNFSKELDGQISPNAAICMQITILHSSEVCNSVKPLLQEIGELLGKFDLPEQLSSLDAVRQKCLQILANMRKDQDIRIRNYQTLGLCAGAAIAILLL